MSYDPYYSNSAAYERYLGEDTRHEAHSSRFSHHLSQSQSSPRTHSMTRLGSRISSKQRWPPPPLVEDEMQSISREHSPESIGLAVAEAQMRGAVDQTPIILEANPGAFPQAAPPSLQQRSSSASSRRSKSSRESLEPHTPPEIVPTNADRRYVWRPKKDIQIPVSYDDPEPKEKATATKKVGATKVSATAKKEPAVASEDKQKGEAAVEQKSSKQIPAPLPPLMTAREPSPYVFSPASGKSTTTSNAGSAGLLSPDARYGTGEVNGLRNTLDANGSTHHYNRLRAQSANSVERPQSARNSSWAGYPTKQSSSDLSRLTPTSPNPPYSWSTSNSKHDSSDDLEISPDEENYTRKRSTRHSSQSEQARQSGASRYDDATRRSRKSSQLSDVDRMSNRHSGTFERLSVQDTRHYSTSVPNSAPLPRSSRRNTSPRSSPYPSPERSPPPSPRSDAYKHPLGSLYGSKSKYNDRPSSPISISNPSARRSKPLSRSSSPLPSPQLSQGPKFEGADLGFLSKQSPLGIPLSSPLSIPTSVPLSIPLSIPLPKSRQTSPLPSPTPDSPLRANVRVDVGGNSPSSKKISITPIDNTLRHPREKSTSASSSTVMSPQGYLSSSRGSQRRSPSTLNTNALQIDTEAPRRSFEAPPSPIRSRTITSHPSPKSLPAFHEHCRRSIPTSRYDDWSSIPECPGLNICPNCRHAIEDRGYKGRFIFDPPRAPGQKIRCDVSNGYVSHAWTQILSGMAVIPLLQELMAVEREEQACPGKHNDVRGWYRVWEPESKRYLSDFMICACCARRIELLFPTLRATVLHRLAGRHASICDLRPDSHRFARYLDTLANTAADADVHRRPPNLFAFVRLARRMADKRECLRDDQLLHATWHFPPQLPDFTVCAECFDTVVVPRRESAGSATATPAATDVALAISPHAAPLPPHHHHQGPVSCQLYSARMRAVFADACARRDFARLSAEVLRRVAMERDLQAKMARLPPELREGEEAMALVREWKRWE